MSKKTLFIFVKNTLFIFVKKKQRDFVREKMKRFLFTLIALAALLSICTCTTDDLLSGLTDTSEATGSGGGVRFGVESGTRVENRGSTRTFDNGDLVGCVVCTLATTTADDGSSTYSYEMLVNSKWCVDSLNATLCPLEYWATGSSGTLEKTTIGDSHTCLFDYDDGNTVINYVDGLYDYDDGALYFFYYTPYVEPDETNTAALDSIPRDTTFSFTTGTDGSVTRTATAGDYLMGPATDSDLKYSGASALTAYDWHSFPMFVHRDQRTAAHAAGSMWMTEQYTQGLYPGSTQDVSLTFTPHTADLLVTTYEDIAFAALVPAEDTTTTTTTSEDGSTSTTVTTITRQPITLGQQINLQTGELSQLTTDSTTTDTIWGNTDTSDSGQYIFRLPGQTNFAPRLLFRYADETLPDGYFRYMDLDEFTGNNSDDDATTGVILPGYQYGVSIPSRYTLATYTLYFSSTSAYVESESGFFNLGFRCTADSHTLSYTALSTAITKSGIVDGVSSFSYYLNMRNNALSCTSTGGSGEYIGFTIPEEDGPMDLVIYLEYNSSTPGLRLLKLPNTFDFSKDIAEYTNSFTYNGTTYTPTTLTTTTGTDDNGTSICVINESGLEAGYTYILTRSANSPYVVLLVLTNDNISLAPRRRQAE